MRHPAFYLATLASGTFCYTYWNTKPVARIVQGWFFIIPITLAKWTRYFQGKVHQESHIDVKISNEKQRHCISFQRAAMTKYHRLVAQNNRNLLSRSSGDWQSEISRAMFPLKSVGDPFLPLPRFWRFASNPWHSLVCSCSTWSLPLLSPGIPLCVSVFTWHFPFIRTPVILG